MITSIGRVANPDLLFLCATYAVGVASCVRLGGQGAQRVPFEL